MMNESQRSGKDESNLLAVHVRSAVQTFVLGLGVALVATASGATMAPISVTGFNRDVVIENTATAPPYTNFALEFNPGEGTAYYESGLPGTSFGLPTSGFFTGVAGDGSVFEFQPYTADNALVFSSETGLTAGTLTLVSPDVFSRVAIIANSANATATSVGTVILNFEDGSSYVTNYNAFDWFNNQGFALQGVDRIRLATGITSGGPSNPRFYQTTIDIAAALGSQNNALVSLTFTKASSANSTAVYAISGLPTSQVGLPSVANVPATSVLAKTAVLGGQVTDTGGETPATTLYYGTTDGGTTSAAWAHSIVLGRQSGAFSVLVSDLTPDTSYYFAVQAVNSAGASWAVPSQSFTSSPLTVPTVSNAAATGVQGTYATLNGAVLAWGGELPSVNVYYGTTDGGNNPASWAHSIALGPQPGAFSQTVSGLQPDTTYYFTCSAFNSAGTAWAGSSQNYLTHAADTPSTAVAMLTQHNDNARTGMNLRESTLTTTNVNTNLFGLVVSLPVDDQIYAQPLVMTNVSILGRGTHNVVLVCTVNDSVYAFDADNPAVTVPYWTTSFINPPNIVPPRNTDMTGACGGNYQDFSGSFGIVGTPVIDPATGTMYLVARTKEFATNFVQRLHALDVATGLERPNSPVVIAATNGVPFDPYKQNQRPSLLLANGYVYITWSSHCDWTPYHGWVIGYNVSNLLQPPISFNDTPSGSQGGVWMSNQGPVADTNGNVYLSTGNGTFDGVNNFGECFIKLTPGGGNLNLASWFAPYNWNSLNGADQDLGSGGVLLIPGTSLLLSGGKQGVLYLVNKDNMGGVSLGSSDTNVVQSFQVTSDEVHGGPVWWDGPGSSYMYVWPSSVHLQQYLFNRSQGAFGLPAQSQGATAAPRGQPGGILSLSANGNTAGRAIVWAVHQLNGDANQSVRPGILHAYDAQDVSRELWNSQMLSSRDAVGSFAKFVPPTVVNGKVYLATFSGRLDVYGLLTTPPSILAQPQSTTAFAGNSVTFTVAASGPQPFAYQWTFNGSPLPGATTNSLTLPSVSLANAGVYSVQVSNPFGATISSNASLAITTVASVGDNSVGELIPQGNNSPAVAIAAGSWHNLILKRDGSITAAGDNSDGQCNVPTSLSNAVGIAAGGYHSLALNFDGTATGWGANGAQQATSPPGLSGVVVLAAGTWHSLALRSDGTVVGWGDNSAGQLNSPTGLNTAVAIAAGGNHSLALRTDGTVVAWGDNSDAFGNFVGQSVVPVGLSGVISVAAGDYHSLAVTTNGTVIAWGDNSDGQCQPPVGLSNVVAVAGGGGHSVALKTDGTVVAWGNNWNGQCSLPALTNAIAIAAGEADTLVLLGGVPGHPQIVRTLLKGNQFGILLETTSGSNYELEYKTSLDSPTWQTVTTLRGSGTLQLLLDRNASGPQRFYRVRQW